MYVCFSVLSKIPNDSLDCPLLVESFPLLTKYFLLSACIRIFLFTTAGTLQGVKTVCGHGAYIYVCAYSFKVCFYSLKANMHSYFKTIKTIKYVSYFNSSDSNITIKLLCKVS